jgi:hypothetical protein
VGVGGLGGFYLKASQSIEIGNLKDIVDGIYVILGPNPPALRPDPEDLKSDGDEIGNSLLGKYLFEATER